MHYLFVDETYRDANDGRAILIATWAVDLQTLNKRVRILNELRQPGKASILKRIDSSLDSLDAWALVARASLEKSLFRPGEIDICKDVRAMARTDTVWSVSTALAVAELTRQLHCSGQAVGTVDIYFDPRSLTADHVKAWEKGLRKNLVSVARRSGLGDLKIRHIEAVVKPKNKAIPGKLQLGTWMADRLCSKSDQIIRGDVTSRIKVWDMSDVVRRTVQQWDGKAYHD